MLVGGYVDMTIPPPSVLSNYIDNDDDYITDPDKVRDILPQPFRLINKIVDITFDIAWDEINKREEQRIADSLRVRPPKFECQVQSKIGGARIMTSSCDGDYVFVGTETGVAVIKSISGEFIDQFFDEDVIITQITTSILDEGLHIISTIDVQGISRLFLFNGDSINLAKILTETEGTITNKVEVSAETDYIAVSSVNQASREAWIDFHKVPKDVWIKEASTLKEKSATKVEEPVFPTETRESGQTTPEAEQKDTTPATTPVPNEPTSHESKSQSSFRFSNTTIFLKVKAPTPLKPCTAANAFNAFKVVDSNPDVIASGQNHLLSQSHLDARETVFRSKHKDLMAYQTDEEPEQAVRVPTIHFIKATRFCPSGYDSGKPTSAIIWWQGKNQFMTYSLLKQAKDVNYKPEQFWPMPHKITASATSSCTQLFALGLENGTVIIWDLFTSLQRRIHSVTPGIPVLQLEFMNPAVTPQEQPFHAHLPYQMQTSSYVLALSENGQFSYCDTTMGMELVKSTKVVHDELDSRMQKFALLPGIPFMVLATFNDGGLYIIHALNGNFICQIVAPQTHQLDEDSLGTVAARGKSIICNALLPEPPEPTEVEPNDTDSEFIPEDIPVEPRTTLFILKCLKFPVLETSFAKELPKVPYVLHTTIDKRLDALMQQRVSQQPIRQARLQAAWQNMTSTLDLILQSKEDRPKTAGSRYAESTVAGSEADLINSTFFKV